MASSIEKLIVDKLNNDNYFIWKYRVEMLLKKEDCWKVIEGTAPNPITTQWEKAEIQAAGWIVQMVDNSQLVHIRKHKTAKEMWNALQEYHEKGTGNNSVQIIKEICGRRLTENGDLEAHLNWLTNMYQKLEDLGEEKLSEKWMIGILFSQLPGCYDTIVTALQSQDISAMKMTNVSAKLIDEYKKQLDRKGTDRTSSESMLKLSSDKVKCYFCNKNGHFKSNCEKFKSWLKKKEKGNQKVNVVQSENADEMLFMMSGESMKKGGSNDNNWIIDSGATCHVTNKKELLSEFQAENKVKIQVADGRGITSAGSGIARIEFINEKNESVWARISDVHYVPEIDLNVLSVMKLTDKGVTVEFREKVCHLKFKDKTFGVGELYVNNQYTLKQPHKVSVLTNVHDKCIHYWHRACGHRDPAIVKELPNGKMVDGVYMKDCKVKMCCETCIKGKLTRLPFPKKSLSSSKTVLELVHTDVCGPMNTASHSGKKYLLTFIDDFSRFTVIYFLSHKSEVFGKYKEYIEMVKNKFQRLPQRFRSDRGGEYTGNNLTSYLRSRGIKYDFTTPYSPEQNGVAERKNRTLVEMGRCCLIEGNLENRFWAEAVATANHIQNRLPTKAVDKTPYELWNDTKPNIKYFKPFGSKCFVHVPDAKRRKLDDKAIPAIFVGYDEHSKGYRCFSKEFNRVYVSRDVKFVDGTNSENRNDEQNEKAIECATGSMTGGTLPSIDPTENTIEISNNIENSTLVFNEFDNTDGCAIQEEIPEITPDNEFSVVDEMMNEGTRRVSSRLNKGLAPRRLIEEIDVIKSNEEEPKTLEEALKNKHKEKWLEAMQDEIKSLKENNTWELVSLPEGSNVVSCKWVYKIKSNVDGSIQKYKARLVARGFTQKYGCDFDEVFAPVAMQTTFRMLLCVASKLNMTIYHLDAKTAFLNGKLEETIYMNQPPGFENETNSNAVCKLNRSIYGLKQSARLWNETLKGVLSEAGFVQCHSDPCLYKSVIDGDLCFILIYVDDILFANRSKEVCQKVEIFLNTKFKINNLGEVKQYLGIEVTKDLQNSFNICQRSYIEKIAKELTLENAKPSKIPLRVDYDKSQVSSSLLVNNKNYRKAIGSLLYVAINTRPDVAASVSILAQKVEKPTQNDWTEVKRLVKYLLSTKYLKLHLGFNSQEKQLVGFADANWAENKRDRKSNSGYLFKLFGSTISWSCRKQTCVSLSSTEAEFIALSEACKELIWLQDLMKDFNISLELPTTVYEDNQSCLALIQKENISGRSKHIDVRRSFAKDCEQRGLADFQYCETNEMIADLLTKPLCEVKLNKFRLMMGLH